MCGIVGTITTKESEVKTNKLLLNRLLINSEVRGTDATGVSFVDKGKLHVLKAPVPATKFIALPEYKKTDHRP